MSAILSHEKQFYRKILRVEALILLVFSLVVSVAQGGNVGLSFLGGSLAGFVPQCLFVYWIFFRNRAKNVNKMTAFYRGEGLKWLATIALIVATFRFYPQLSHLAFFAGYFLGLLGNIAVPIYFKRRAR